MKCLQYVDVERVKIKIIFDKKEGLFRFNVELDKLKLFKNIKLLIKIL